MSRLLLPYGAKKFAALTAKPGAVKSARAAAAGFAPYGSADNADLVSKVGIHKISRAASAPRRVVRRIAD